MTIALWIIAIVESIRLVEQTIQLKAILAKDTNEQVKRATDAFIENLQKTDEQWMREILDRAYGERRADEYTD